MKEAGEISFSSLSFPITTDPDHTSPWLLVSQGKNLQNHTFYNISNDERLNTNILEFRNKHISHANYGWLAVMDVDQSPLECCLINTSSKEKIQLPCIEAGLKSNRPLCYQCILSKPPTDSNCLVLLLSTYDDSLLFCRLGDEKFVETRRRLGGNLFQAAASNNGRIVAWISRTGKFFEVEFGGKELMIPKQLVNSMGKPCQIPPSAARRSADYFVECCGDLLLVHLICHHHAEEVACFRIFKVDECLELRNIGDCTIFLGGDGGTCASSSGKPGIKKNSIYYVWTDTRMYVYDIEDRSKTLLRPPVTRGAKSLMSWVMM